MLIDTEHHTNMNIEYNRYDIYCIYTRLDREMNMDGWMQA